MVSPMAAFGPWVVPPAQLMCMHYALATSHMNTLFFASAAGNCLPPSPAVHRMPAAFRY